jgi:mannose-6-phosphate isomerase
MMPVALAPNLIDHFYLGGDRIAALRGIQTTSARQPEEWLAATVSRADEEMIGLSRTESGELLRELVAQDPASWTGPDHAAARNAGDVGILVKLLDAGQRLPVHAHPDRSFARSHLDCPYGKTESWLVLGSEPGAAVHLGWKTDIDADELASRRDSQDGDWMLGHMNRVEVTPGMGILVPAGTVHAIDAGVFVMEVQEPTDFSIVLEWSITTSTREESHLGIGFDAAMQAVSTSALPYSRLGRLVVRNDLAARHLEARSVLPAGADPFFTLHHVAPMPGSAARISSGFAVVLVLSGNARLVGARGSIHVSAGQVLAVPYAFGDWEVDGDASALVGAPGSGWPASLGQEQR